MATPAIANGLYFLDTPNGKAGNIKISKVARIVEILPANTINGLKIISASVEYKYPSLNIS